MSLASAERTVHLVYDCHAERQQTAKRRSRPHPDRFQNLTNLEQFLILQLCQPARLPSILVSIHAFTAIPCTNSGRFIKLMLAWLQGWCPTAKQPSSRARGRCRHRLLSPEQSTCIKVGGRSRASPRDHRVSSYCRASIHD